MKAPYRMRDDMGIIDKLDETLNRGFVAYFKYHVSYPRNCQIKLQYTLTLIRKIVFWYKYAQGYLPIFSAF
jgi:hypothetical protein